MNASEEIDSFHLASKYWKKKVLNRDKNIRLLKKKECISNIKINREDLSYFNQITADNQIAQYTVITAIYSFLLKRLIHEFDGYLTSNCLDHHNSLLLSLPVDLNISFKDYLQKVKEEILESLTYFDKYNVNETDNVIDLMSFSNFSINVNSKNNINCSGILFDLKINENMDIHIIYNEYFIKKEIIGYLTQHFTYFIINLKKYITSNLSSYSLLTKEAEHKLIVDFNDTEAVYPRDKTIALLFEEQVKKTPENISVIFGETKLTYSELNQKANQFANYISSKYKINTGDIIGVHLPKSDLGIVSFLAILKLGGVYLPIDTNYPLQRINYLIKDSGLKLLINEGINTLNIDSCALISAHSIVWEQYDAANINTVILPEDLAYIIYTSGSTGKPKGVMIEHHSAVNMFVDQIRAFKITDKDKVVLFASVSFDASVSEILMALNSGAALGIPAEDEIKDKDRFVASLKTFQATVVTFPPSYLGLLSNDDISGLRCVITAGESANPSVALSITELGIDYYNAYGPTECTVCVSIYKVTKDDFNKSIIPIGKPIANTQVYILDEGLQPVPIGVSGKIYVSGAGLARGYLNKPELTKEKFIVNPFLDKEQLYDTGDLGCWLSDGTIEFHGRMDQQVKLRGFRIELGEIENTILQYSKDLKQTVVEVKEHNHEKVLVAYLVAGTIVDKSGLRSFLQSKLPDHMIPGFYVSLERLPLTPNGKIDKKSLPELSGVDLIRKIYVGPRNKTEETLAKIWEEVLNIEKIGIHDDFFELGGHSLIVGQIINRINQKLGKTISFKTFFSNATIEKITAQLQDDNYLPILKAPDADSYPLTASQNRLWILSQLEGGSLAYNMPAAVKLNGALDIDKFEEAFKRLINRHEILRTYFKTNNEGEVQQFILPENQLNFKIVQEDYSSTENQEEKVRNYLSERNREIFDLENAPLIRASLIKLRKDEHVFFLSMHHIIGDGWTIELIIDEIAKTYNALRKGKTIEQPELKIQYKDYAIWINNELQHEKYRAAETYWLNQFSGQIPVLDLPICKTRPLVQTYNGDVVKHTFSKEFSEKLNRFSKENDLTLFMTLMSGINTLLYRYTGQDDIIVGTPVAGREHPDLENQLGLFLNTLAIRTRIKEKVSFLDLIVDQKETLLEAYDHQNYPFDLLISKLNLKRDTSRSTLFDVLVVLQNQSQLNNINTEELADIEISYFDFNNETTQVDISFKFVETDSLHLIIEYNTDIYKGYLIEKMFSHFENLLTQLLENPLAAIEQINYLSEEELKQVLIDFNNTEVIYPTEKTAVSLFRAQVLKTPDKEALVDGNRSYSYSELDVLSSQIAEHLITVYGEKDQSPIAVLLERSANLVVVLLGILKSGRPYIPLDPAFPKDRLRYIIDNSKSKLLFTQKNDGLDNLEDDVAVLELENILERIHDFQGIVNKVILPKDTAYIIYTSGSTGNPKGVEIGHQSLVNFLTSIQESPGVNVNDLFFSVTTYSFDISILEFFVPLISGALLYVAEKHVLADPHLIIKKIEEVKPTIIQATPSFYQMLFNASWEGDKRLKILCGGDLLSEALAADLIDKSSEVWNMYGPTETTIWSSMKKIEFPEDASNIGTPIPNTQFYILDHYLNPMPVNIPGAIYIAGAGLAKGYYKNEELTKEKFINNPFDSGTLLYETGDVGKWNENGEIEFLGRNDSQVKIRGYRIELGDIETQLNQINGIKASVVIAKKEDRQEAFLAAYILKGEEEIDLEKIMTHLQISLPYYMIPNVIIPLEEFPLTPNQKIDRKALPSISSEYIFRKKYVAPQSDIEKGLALIWEDVLGIKNIGVTDDFFELGGHSLLLGQVINRIQKLLGGSVGYRDFFTNPTIFGLSKVIEISTYVKIPNVKESESYPLTPSQNRLWVLSQLEGGELAYNMPAAVILKGIIEINKFHEAFLKLIARHEILRTSFRANHEGEISQFIVPVQQVEFKISKQDFLLSNDKEKLVEDYLVQENNKIFDLEKAPLMRTSLIRLESDTYMFFLSLHHIICDGWSLEVIISEVIKIYNALTLEKESELPELNIQYKDYAVWLNDGLSQEKYKLSEQYWMQQFTGELPVLDFPSFKIRPLHQTHNGNNITHQFSKDFLEKLKLFSVKHDVTLFMTLMTGINSLLHIYTDQNDIIIGTPIAGREHPDLENQIGLYLNTLAIRTVLEKNISFLNLLEKQKEILLGAYEHQNYPFDELVSKLNLKRDSSRSALFDVLVVLQNQSQLNNLGNEELVNLEVSNYKVPRKSSQFDISFTFVETTVLELTIEYNTDIYDAYLIERMFFHFEKILIESITNPESIIQNIKYLKDEEKRKLLVDFNATQAIYPREKTIVDLFEEQVAENPDNIAVLFQEKVFTYADLNKKVNQLAFYLRENYAIQPNDFVGIKLERSEKMIIAILGVLKSGAAYIPIDVNYPEQRIDYIERNSNSKLVIDESELERFLQNSENYSKNNLQKIHTSNDLAYVIYTSGSTGNPKGVMIENSSLTNYLIWAKDYYLTNDLTNTNFGLFTSLSFDLTVTSLFLPLISGGCLRIADPTSNVIEIFQNYLESDISCIKLTPAHISALEGLGLRSDKIELAIVGGEELRKHHIEILKSINPAIRIINEYGPTETTVGCTIYEVTSTEKPILIGRPIANTSIYIVDEFNNIQTEGITGEICIGGSGLARGYLNRADLTAEKFVSNPFQEGTKMYKTGDLGKWLPNGNIVFLGRKDKQVKLRGYRLELSEIESAITQFSKDIKQTLVELKEVNLDPSLVSYIVASQDIDTTKLIEFLQTKLPNYMIPGFYITMDSFPLTPNGKIDRASLPSISDNNIIKKEYIAPRNETEKKLVGLWKKVLAVDNIGVLDNFFELGGHSLKAMKLIGLINIEFKIKLVINDLFKNIVLEDQAILIENISDLCVSDEENNQNNTETEIFSI